MSIYTCISSRITTVIQVVRNYQLNYNWFNEPFTDSLYKLLILRCAWLNLWDKRTTTGRINQISNIMGVFLYSYIAQKLSITHDPNLTIIHPFSSEVRSQLYKISLDLKRRKRVCFNMFSRHYIQRSKWVIYVHL